jgi:hypothetical protein
VNHFTDAEVLAAIQRNTHPNAQRVVWMAEGRDFILLPGSDVEPLRLSCIMHHHHQNGSTTWRYGVVNDTVYLSQVAEDVEPTQ